MQSPADSLPECLRWPSDPEGREDMVRDLPQQMFPQLSGAFVSAEPPPPEVLWEAWNVRPRALMSLAMLEVSDDTMTFWLHAYELAWNLRMSGGKATKSQTADAEKSVQRPYIQACAHLLLGKTSSATVPIGKVDGHQQGRVQFLCLTKCEGASALHQHPQFAWHGRRFNQAFLDGLAAGWQQANGQDAEPCQIFWHITEADGRPVTSEQQSGTSASAASFRAFWHVRRDLRLDEEVFVLASCGSGDGSIQDVGDLGAKISAIQQHRDSLNQEAAATIVIAATATNRTPQDEIAIARASTWAEVKTVATTAELTAVRSCATSAVIAYMEHLAKKLDETPWSRDGKPIHLSDVHVPPQVWKDEYSFHPAAADEPSRGERDWRPAGYDPASADREVAPRLKQQRRKVRVPWITEFRRPHHQPIVIVGGPGFGKTSLLRWTAREMVLESLAVLHARSNAWSEVRWPIITDLAAWLSKGGDSHDALRDAALDFSPLPKTHPKLQREALPQLVEMRLITQTEHTHLFLDALDQVPADKLRLLQKRLGGLDSFASRLVFSTREAALSSHLPTVPFPRLTILEAAALSIEDARNLAAKWLDSKRATRLEAHLRAQPAMSVVADSPLLLTLACGIVARSPNAELPETAAYLYRDLMQSLARGEWRDAGTDAVHEPDALLARLRQMAWRLFSREAGINRFSRDTLVRALNGGSSSADAQADAALNQLCRLGFLEGSGHSEGEPHYQFRHTTFLEFLAASNLAAEINAEGWAQAQVTHWHSENGWQPSKVSEVLDASAFEPAWEPLFTFTAGLLKQPKPLLEMLADRRRDDIYRHRLALLCSCYGSLAADKEDGVEDLMERILPMLERMGRTARRHHHDRWRSWLKAVGHLLNLPKAGSRIIKFFTQSEDFRHGMVLHQGLLDIVARAAQHSRCNVGMETLFAFCEGRFDHREVGDAAKKIVELAEDLGLPQSIKRLEQAMNAADGNPWNQTKLALALLRASDSQVVVNAFDRLNALAENESIDQSCRSMAVAALVHALDTPLETQAAEVIASYLLDPASDAIHHECWRSLAFHIVQAAWRYQSKVTFALQCLVLRLAPDDSYFCREIGKSLIRREDKIARNLGIQLLLKQVRTEATQSYEHAEVVKALFEHGGDSERQEALSTLLIKIKAPIADGCRRIAAVATLLETGHAYDDEIKQYLGEFGGAADLRPWAIVRAAAIAHERNDNATFAILMPRLRCILNERFNLQPHETGVSERQDVAKLLFGTDEWELIERQALARLRDNYVVNDDGCLSLHVACFGAKASSLFNLIEELLAVRKWNSHPWALLMSELVLRGWRFQISRRKIVVLRRGQEKPRSDADFGRFV